MNNPLAKSTIRTRGAVIYTRVSTEDQVQHGTSMETQRDACRAKASALGLPIIAEEMDAGISGALYMSRTGLQSALTYIEEGKANTLICHELSRLSREVRHQQDIKARVEGVDGRLIFCDMVFDDTEEGDLNFTIQGGFKQYERKIIRKRTMAGKRKRAQEGQQPQRSRPAFGYHIVTNAEIDCGLYPPTMRGRYIIVEETATLVRRIFQEYVYEFSTLPKIAKSLNSAGIPTPGNGRLWQHATLNFILTNPAYKGEPVSGRQKCHTDESRLQQRHKWTGRPITQVNVRQPVPEEDWLKLSAPPLVDEETWDMAQRRRESNRTTLKGNPRQIRMLSGRTVCPHCGAAGVIKQQRANGKTYPYFICGRQRRAAQLTGEKPCTGDLYPVSLIEEATVRAMQEAWQRPEALATASLIYDCNEPMQDAVSVHKEIVRLTRALDELKQEEMVTARAQTAGMQAGASPEAYNELFANIAARRRGLEDQRGLVNKGLTKNGELQKAGQQQVSNAVQKALEDAWRVLSSSEVSGSTKRDILMTLVDKVVLHKDGVEVVFSPGLFEEAGIKDPRSNCYTTCMGINTQR